MNSIDLPVSFGEALDKLSILEIKLEKINDDRKKDVQVEYDLLYAKLNDLFTPDVKYQYNVLKHINLIIWEKQDILRYEADDGINKLELALFVCEENDRRFRVKAKINNLMNSKLREQKGYVRRKAYIKCSDDIANLKQLCGEIRYYSTIYDQVFVIVNCDIYETAKLMFRDDSTICIVTSMPEGVKEINSNKSVYLMYEYFCS